MEISDPPPGVRVAVAAESLPGPAAARPGLFLDRDGVLVEEVEYLHRVEELRVQAGAVALIHAAHAAGHAVAVVSNQSGIDRGIYGWDDYDRVEKELARCLAEEGVSVDARVACAFHPRFTPGWGEAHAYWRKPGPGMLVLAAERLAVDLARSWMIGDMASDARAAKAAGLAGAIHLRTGPHGEPNEAGALAEATAAFAVEATSGLGEAAGLLRPRGLLS